MQRQLQTCTQPPDADAFFDLLTGPQLLERAAALAPPHRNRLFPPMKVLSMFCTQALSADGSCQQAVDAEAIKRMAHGLPHCSSDTGAYCKARQRLPPDIPRTLAGVSALPSGFGQERSRRQTAESGPVRRNQPWRAAPRERL